MARIGGKIMEYITLNNGVKMPMAGLEFSKSRIKKNV